MLQYTLANFRLAERYLLHIDTNYMVHQLYYEKIGYNIP